MIPPIALAPPLYRMVWWQETPTRRAIMMLGRDHVDPGKIWARRWITTAGGRWSEHEIIIDRAHVTREQASGREAEKAITKALTQLCHRCGVRVYERRKGRPPWRCLNGRCPTCCVLSCEAHHVDPEQEEGEGPSRAETSLA